MISRLANLSSIHSTVPSAVTFATSCLSLPFTNCIVSFPALSIWYAYSPPLTLPNLLSISCLLTICSLAVLVALYALSSTVSYADLVSAFIPFNPLAVFCNFCITSSIWSFSLISWPSNLLVWYALSLFNFSNLLLANLSNPVSVVPPALVTFSSSKFLLAFGFSNALSNSLAYVWIPGLFGSALNPPDGSNSMYPNLLISAFTVSKPLPLMYISIKSTSSFGPFEFSSNWSEPITSFISLMSCSSEAFIDLTFSSMLASIWAPAVLTVASASAATCLPNFIAFNLLSVDSLPFIKSLNCLVASYVLSSITSLALKSTSSLASNSAIVLYMFLIASVFSSLAALVSASLITLPYVNAFGALSSKSSVNLPCIASTLLTTSSVAPVANPTSASAFSGAV